MTLAEYLTEQTATALAAKVGCEVSTITRIAKGDRSPSIDLAVRIERATDGAVTVADLAAAAVAVSPPAEEAGV